MRTLPQQTAGRPGAPGAADRIGLTVAGLALIMVLPVLDQTIVATALPSIAADLGGLGQIAWVVNAYLLGVGLSAPLYGKMGDVYGRKPLLTAAVIVFVAASALAGASRSMGELIACRAVQGLGGGGLMNLTTAAVADLLPPAERGRVQGYTGAVFAAGSIGGPLLGGVFCGTIGWRWVFYINVPVALAGLAIVLRWFRVRSRRVRQPLDWAGGVLLAGAVTCALLVTDWGGITHPWGSPVIVSLIAASAAAAAAFVWRETRAASPVLPPALWRGKVFRVAIPSSFLLGAALFGTVVFLPQFFQVVQGRSATVSGALLTPAMLAAVVTGVYSATRMSATGRYRQYPVIGALLLIAGLLPLTSLSPAAPAWLILVAELALGLGVGFQMQLMVIIVQNAVPYRDVGTATAATLLFRSLGGAAGTAVFSTLMLRRFSARLAVMLPGHAAGGLASRLYQGIVAGILPLSGGARAIIVSAFGQSVSSSTCGPSPSRRPCCCSPSSCRPCRCAPGSTTAAAMRRELEPASAASVPSAAVSETPARMPSPTVQQSDLGTRARIREAALTLFGSAGFGVPLRAIADAAGVSAGLVVHHFGSKERLREAVDQAVLRTFLDRFAAIPDDLPADGLALEMAGAFADVLGASPQIRQYLRRSLDDGTPASMTIFDSLVAATERGLDRLDRAGGLRPGSDPQWRPFQVLSVILGPLLLEPVIERHVSDPYAPENVRRRTAANLDFIARGLFTQPGARP